MTIASMYGDLAFRNVPDHPERAFDMIEFGLQAETFRTGHLQTRKMPKAYRYLNHMAMQDVTDALAKPDTFVWSNIFAPVEILQTFGLSAVSMEAISSFLSGFWVEDRLIDGADQVGYSSTLCNYHKTFIGALEAGILPKPVGGVTTSTVCDGNINTFRTMGDLQGIPTYLIDVPHAWSPVAEDYVVGQLEEFIEVLEGWTGRSFDADALSEALERENRSKALYLEFLQKRKTHAYPSTLTLQLFTLFATHLAIGNERALKFFEMLVDDVDHYPAFAGKRIFWVHIAPYSEPTLESYFNYSDTLEIVADDFNLDYVGPLDVANPLHALARKMIDNIYNGNVERKIERVKRGVTEYACDGVVELCNWGCRQSAGGALLLRNALREQGTPMLILDGDGIDRRNNQDGQTKTRFEAFLEVLDNTSAPVREAGTR